MPKQVTKSSLSAKLKGKLGKAIDNHREDETNYGQMDLPDGIDNGLARIVECKFGQYENGDNKGEYFFFAAAVVLDPKSHNGIPIEGLRTQIGPEPLCDTPGRSRQTLDDHVSWIMNELAKMGASRDEMTEDNLEEVAESIKEEQPVIRFRTWKGQATKQFPNPRTNHQWGGVVDYDGGDEADAGAVDDQTPDEPIEEEPPKKTAGKGKVTPKKAEKEEPDLDALAAEADGGDEDAATELAGLANAVGVDHEQLGTWAEVVEAMQATDDGDATEDETEPDENEVPEKGGVYQYKPPKARKTVECEVTAVFEQKQTVNLKNLEDGKTTYKSVPWDHLAQDEE